MDILTKLIFSFYREDKQIQSRLAPLLRSRLSRSWGSVRIDCLNAEHLEEVSLLSGYISAPLAGIDFCRKIIVRAPDVAERTFLVHALFKKDSLIG